MIRFALKKSHLVIKLMNDLVIIEQHQSSELHHVELAQA